ncbi:helix-turn-helix domain-containing protein [Flexivirga meconopsidis]|uniref:helix-turn-helix domain-containing protein n=1 Tax=Flexivirga meconopsidis TaxID=2977121 RepID=UPI00223F9C4A|nr:helix-turn-helix transcriptional regulator [Flexivirga meconopsidis]
MAVATNELGAFLTHLRARQQPADHGVVVTARRRVSGLRREEAAQLIGVSSEYYARLERGIARSPSPAVLDSIAAVFGLSPIELAHLRQLAAPVPHRAKATRQRSASRSLRPQLRGLLDAMPGPALVSNHRFDVLGANRLAKAVFFDFDSAHQANLARFLFADPESMRRYRDWPQIAEATVGQLRVARARYPHDEQLEQLVSDLMTDGHHFARLWRGRDVAERSFGTKRFWLDAVGALDLDYENLELPEDRALRLVVFHAPPGSAAHDQLRILASLDAPSVDRAAGRSAVASD